MDNKSNYKLSVVAPIFPVCDIDISKKYYLDKLKFSIGFEWSDEGNSEVNYLILHNGDTELHLSKSKETRKTAAYFFVDNIQGYHYEIKKSGANIINDIADQEWDMREIEVHDPDGNVIIFGEHKSRI